MPDPRTPATDPASVPGDEAPPRRGVSRRELLAGAAGAAAASALEKLAPGRLAAQEAALPPAGSLPDPTTVPGRPAGVSEGRSPFERPARLARTTGTSSRTPLQDLSGTITPSDLHFERHHGGVAEVDPRTYELLVHGMVERPTVFTLEDIRGLPAVSRLAFLECAGNFPRNAGEETTPQEICGLTSQSEWTGVPLSLIFREVGVRPEATWFLAEGMDAAVMTRSVPVEKALDDALLAWGQNGEPLRPEQGYPVRLFLPGWEGNSNVKWLRRIELSDRPFMTREETSKYTEPILGGKARQFSFVMDARSVITEPCYPKTARPGWIDVRGIAWSGRGRIARAELSFDEGATWVEAELQEPVLPKAHTRFRYLWEWDGREATVMSRAVDETGYVQPTVRELVAARGPGSSYHLNPVTGWRLLPDGRVVLRREEWA